MTRDTENLWPARQKKLIRLPALNALQAFVYVGRSGSIRRAGEMMNVDHSSISRHLKNLEERLQMPLFRREGRGIALTPEGKLYHDEISKAFDIMEAATRSIAPSRMRTLEIFAMPGIAHRVLMPRLAELSSVAENWEIVLHTSLDAVPTNADGKKVTIRFELQQPDLPGMVTERFVVPRLFPVASPRVDPRWLEVREAADLYQLPLVMGKSRSLWQVWFDANGIAAPSMHNVPKMHNAHLCLEAAQFGLGIALGTDVLVENEIRSGNLIELLDSDVRVGGYYISAVHEDWDSRPILSLRRWLQDLFEDREVADSTRELIPRSLSMP